MHETHIQQIRALRFQRGSLGLLIVPFLMCFADQAQAETEVHHVPPAVWEAGVGQRLEARVQDDWLVDRIWVNIRPLNGQESFHTVSLDRVGDDLFAAPIPAALVQPPGLEYYIESEGEDGIHTVHFASESSPFPIVVRGESDLSRLNDRLARHGGNLTQIRTSFDYVSYGRRRLEDGRLTEPGTDSFWDLRLDYSYRFLSLLYDVHFGLAFLRAEPSLVRVEDVLIPTTLPIGTPDPGLNYGWGGITVELHRYFSAEFDLIFGASHTGFVAGLGTVFRIGQIESTRAEVGLEYIGDVGARGNFTFAWHTIERVPMAFIVELDGRPSSQDPVGSRLSLDVGFEVSSQLTVAARGGYSLRTDGAAEGGPSLGLTSKFQF